MIAGLKPWVHLCRCLRPEGRAFHLSSLKGLASLIAATQHSSFAPCWAIISPPSGLVRRHVHHCRPNVPHSPDAKPRIRLAHLTAQSGGAAPSAGSLAWETAPVASLGPVSPRLVWRNTCGVLIQFRRRDLHQRSCRTCRETLPGVTRSRQRMVDLERNTDRHHYYFYSAVGSPACMRLARLPVTRLSSPWPLAVLGRNRA